MMATLGAETVAAASKAPGPRVFKKLTTKNHSRYMPTMLSSMSYEDTTLRCIDGDLETHRLVLAHMSIYLSTTFNDQLPGEHTIISLPDLGKEMVSKMLDLAYTGSCNLLDSQYDEFHTVMTVLGCRKIDGLTKTKVDYSPYEALTGSEDEIQIVYNGPKVQQEKVVPVIGIKELVNPQNSEKRTVSPGIKAGPYPSSETGRKDADKAESRGEESSSEVVEDESVSESQLVAGPRSQRASSKKRSVGDSSSQDSATFESNGSVPGADSLPDENEEFGNTCKIVRGAADILRKIDTIVSTKVDGTESEMSPSSPSSSQLASSDRQTLNNSHVSSRKLPYPQVNLFTTASSSMVNRSRTPNVEPLMDVDDEEVEQGLTITTPLPDKPDFTNSSSKDEADLEARNTDNCKNSISGTGVKYASKSELNTIGSRRAIVATLQARANRGSSEGENSEGSADRETSGRNFGRKRCRLSTSLEKGLTDIETPIAQPCLDLDSDSWPPKKKQRRGQNSNDADSVKHVDKTSDESPDSRNADLSNPVLITLRSVLEKRKAGRPPGSSKDSSSSSSSTETRFSPRTSERVKSINKEGRTVEDKTDNKEAAGDRP